MHGFVSWLEAFALTIGGPGLFVISLLDSSLFSLPEFNDLLVVLMVLKHPARMPYYALLATLGSVAGCLILFRLSSKGGEAVLRKRFDNRKLDRCKELIERYGVLAICVPALLPPPTPFKPFVVLAGAAGMSQSRFTFAVAGSRAIRYFGIGGLTVWLGPVSRQYLEQNGGALALGAALFIFACGASYFTWQWVRSRQAEPEI
jgi:membrane protein YqaA with SNARE-associated domain